MNITDGKSAQAAARDGMQGQVEHVRHELAGVRTGRASVAIPLRGNFRATSASTDRASGNRPIRWTERPY